MLEGVRKRRVCERVWLEEEKGVRGCGYRKRRGVRGLGWGSEGCERVGLEKRRGVKGRGWRKRGCARVGLEEEKGCEGTGGVGLEKGKRCVRER